MYLETKHWTKRFFMVSGCLIYSQPDLLAESQFDRVAIGVDQNSQVTSWAPSVARIFSKASLFLSEGAKPINLLG